MLFKITKSASNPSLQILEPPKKPLRESDLEKLLVAKENAESKQLNSSIFGEELLIIDNQSHTGQGKRADILAIDRQGNMVVIELKRDKAALGVDTQALQYLASYSSLKGINFINKFEDQISKDNILGFLGDDVKPESINSSSRIILIARSFDETLFSMGEWLSEQGVAFRCISYHPYDIGNENYITFSIAFDRSKATIYRLGSTANERDSKVFWHNIGGEENQEEWWQFLAKHNQIACGFTNSPDDQGAKIMHRYIAGDHIIAYASKKGAVGWGIVKNPNTYKIIDPGASGDFLKGKMRHRLEVEWKSVTKDMTKGIKSNYIKEKFGIHHPVSTSVSMNREAGKELREHMSKEFSSKY
jgi:hypothetical protein